MALGVKDIYQITTELVQQATGRNDLKVTDTSSLVEVGEMTMRVAYEQLFNAIGEMVGRTIFSARPYYRKFGDIQVDPMRYGNIRRKISYEDTGFEESEDWNIGDNLADGQSVDMYKIRKAKPVQLNFTGSKTLQKPRTIFRDQLRVAFQNAGEMESFLTGQTVAFQNEIEQAFENLARATVVNMIGAVSHSSHAEQVVHLLTEFNAINSTEYTAEQVMQDPQTLEPFLKFMVSRVQKVQALLTERSELYHLSPTGHTLSRFTPAEMQRLYLFNPLQIDSRANVFPTVFSPSYLDLSNYTPVNYWQSIKTPMAINITPNELDENGNAKKGEAVSANNVVGILFDRDALGICPAFDYASTTPFNSAGGYVNLYLHWRAQYWNDFTENAVVFLLD